jgi:hypothetical protein
MIEFDRLEEVRAGIEKVRNGGLAVVFKNLFPDVPTWEDFINHAQHEITTPPGHIPAQPYEERFINGVLLRNLFYLMVSNPSDKAFPQSRLVRDVFNELLEDELWPVSAFVNFLGGEKPIAPHCDYRETVYWQCQGNVTWKIYKEENIDQENTYGLKPEMELQLEPGDVIFVGFLVGHSVVTPGPRAAIGFQHKQDDMGRFDESDRVRKEDYKKLGIDVDYNRNS